MPQAQLFIDETGKDGTSEAFFMAGFISTPARWIQFSDEWVAECSLDPPTPRFHMVEAERIHGPKSWWGHQHDASIPAKELVRRRDARLMALTAIIKRNVETLVWAAVRHDDYEKIVRGNIPKPFDDPYFLVFYHLIFSMTRHHAKEKLPAIEWVFDKEGRNGNMALSVFHRMIHNIPIEEHSSISGTPRFEDDNVALPLKAADVLAWHIQRDLRERKSGEFPRRVVTEEFAGMPRNAAFLDAHILPVVVETMNRDLRGV